MAQAATELAIPETVWMDAVVAPWVPGHIGVVRENQEWRYRRVLVVRTEEREARWHLARRASSEQLGGVIAETRFHVGRRHEEVFVAEVLDETAGCNETLQLHLDLEVGQAVGHRAVGRALARGIRLRVHKHAAERRRVAGERAGQILVLSRNRVYVLVAAALRGKGLETS